MIKILNFCIHEIDQILIEIKVLVVCSAIGVLKIKKTDLTLNNLLLTDRAEESQ